MHRSKIISCMCPQNHKWKNRKIWNNEYIRPKKTTHLEKNPEASVDASGFLRI